MKKENKEIIMALRNELPNCMPLEVSYFINNICNLNCKHCYVGYEEKKGSLRIDEWKSVFKDLIEMGALTFGNVGKEPTLNWGKTIALLSFLQEQKNLTGKKRLRYGLVTNAVLLDKLHSDELLETDLNYLDISIDGDQVTHDAIRGTHTYSKTTNNIRIMNEALKEKIFISFTAMETNYQLIPVLVKNLYEMGVKNFLISPYISTSVGTNVHFKDLEFKNKAVVSIVRDLINGSLIPFKNYEELKLYIKSDFITSFDLMSDYVKQGLINIDRLKIDDYGVLFNEYSHGSNSIYLNVVPFDDTFIKTIRLSHDGYVGNCYDMFYTKYPERTIGNLRQKSIQEILQNY